MKLSFKFFCISYIMVLVSSAFAGLLLVSKTTDDLWNERVTQCKYAVTYAINSFYSLSDFGLDRLTQNNFTALEYQIKGALDASIADLQISPITDHTEESVSSLKKNQCLMRYKNTNGKVYLEITSTVILDDNRYFVVCTSDFSDLNTYCAETWQQYRIAVLVISVFCAVILFFLAKKITKPLNRLSKAAEEISDGNYGLCIEANSDDEVGKLTDNFNKMSTVVAASLESIQRECDKRDAFVANFTHEIKTPITSIIGYSNMLATYQLTDGEQRIAAASVYREGKRLEKMSLQLLDIFVTKEEPTKFTAVNLRGIGAHLESVMTFESKKYEVSLAIDFLDVVVLANEELLLSLLYNLIDNAFKASEKSSVVTVKAEQTGGSITISVVDTGHGISKEHISRITEPFYREDKSRSRRNGGAGLGLALCSEICGLHGTELAFESEQGRGTTVSFNLKAVTKCE